jgi:tetratricopeptide (TPR) repeat protein
VVFRDRPEGVVTFSTSDGGKRLVSTLRAAAVDGGTAFASLDLSRAALPRAEDDLWLVFSDGLGTLGEALPHAGGVPVWTITGASLADRALLRHLSQSNGAQLLDLVAMDSRDAVSALTHPQAGLRATVVSPGEAVADLQLVPGADRSRVALTGRLLAPRAEVTLDFGQGRTETVTLRRDAATRASDSNGPVAIAWANGRAETLSLFADRNADELLRLGRRFGLVTANTSLLVLETLAQHLQYGVEPAASRPELLRQYRAQVAANDQATRAQTKDHLEEVVALWSARIQWWEQDFHVAPGFRFHEDEESHGYGGAAAPPARGVVSFGSVTHESSFARSQADFAPPPSPSPVASEQAESKPEAKAGGESNEASIVIKPWDPEVPYLVPLRRAAPRAAYAAYLAERAQYASPAFFLDAAGFLLHAGEKELGLRVLSNLAELRLDDPPLLRVLAWRLSQAGELDLAASVLEKVLRLRPEEPQSLRDLALVLADRAETPAARPDDGQRAVNLLQDVVDRRWDRFPEIELIALMELNRILARAERRGAPLDAHRLDGRLHKLLDVDLRVSLAWDADLTDVDLHLFEPTGEHAFYSHNRTTIGGLVSRDFTQGYGPEEYLVRHAVAGVYAVKAHYYGSRQQTLIGPTTLTATVFTHWGRADEKRQLLTLRLDDIKEMEDIGEVTIGGGHELAKVQSTRRTVAQFRGIRRGMSLDEVKALVGQPDSIADAGELHYRLDDAGEVRVALRGEAGVASVLHVRRGAELELLP